VVADGEDYPVAKVPMGAAAWEGIKREGGRRYGGQQTQQRRKDAMRRIHTSLASLENAFTSSARDGDRSTSLISESKRQRGHQDEREKKRLKTADLVKRQTFRFVHSKSETGIRHSSRSTREAVRRKGRKKKKIMKIEYREK